MNISNIPNKYKQIFLKINKTMEYYIFTKSKEVIKIFKDASDTKLKPTVDDIDTYIKNLSNNYSINKIDIRLKIDSYMIGLFLLSFIIYSFIYLDKSNNIYDVPIEFFELLLKMIDINPFTRIDIFSIVDEYKKIFNL
jgi:hypothetical protein